MAHESVRPETDGVLLEAVVADLLDVLLGHDPASRRRKGPVEGHEVGPRLVELKAHAMRTDGHELAHLFPEDLRASRKLETQPHILRSEAVPIVEFHPTPQL